MIDSLTDYIFQWDIENDIKNIENPAELFGEIFLIGSKYIHQNFLFNPKNIQTHEKNTNLLTFKEKTDWMVSPQDRIVNLFYPIKCEDLGLYVIYKDKSEGIKIKKNKLYAIPFWMTYQFLSENKDKEQEILNLWYWSTERLQQRKTEIFW